MHNLNFQKETIDDVSRFARMCYRRNLSERGNRIDDRAQQLVMKILMALRDGNAETETENN